ncbi:MAG: transglutaminaseTgpA domain-containing protein [Bacillota bacterium]|nr:transglutaminaseTgpA domain-containing protein [Bacillota bacterium]
MNTSYPASPRLAEEAVEARADAGPSIAWRLLEVLLFHAYMGLLVWSFGPFLHVPVEPVPFLLVAVPVALLAWAIARWRWLAPGLVVALVLALGLAARYAPPLWWRLRLYLLVIGQLVAAAWSGHPLATPAPVAYALMAVGGLVAGVMAHRERMSPGRGVWLLGLGAAVLLVQWLWYWDPAYAFLWPAMALGLAWLAAREAVLSAPDPAARRAPPPEGGPSDLPAPGNGGVAPADRAEPPAYAATPGRVLSLGVLAALLLLLLVAVLPTSIPPASLGSLGESLARLMPTLSQLRGAGVPAGGPPLAGFDLSSTGFAQANDRLGGPVLLDPTPVLHLRLYGGPEQGTLYLRGMAEDVYTGSGWKLSQTTEPVRSQPPRPAGEIPPSAPAIRVDVEPAESLPVLFYPLQPLRVTASAPLRADGLGNVYLSGPLDRGYQVVARLIAPGGPGYAPSPQAGPVPPPDEGSDLQLPSGLPARVKRLAEEVTAGRPDPLGKAQALESFLKRSYPYTLDASAPPPGRDFADFFLFDERQGYCTYYSTAMTVMLRTLGIPARWVTGFRVDLGAARGLPDGGRALDVRNADAHAWVEVWIPGRGWVPFDPTPGAGETGSQASSAPSPGPGQVPGERPPLPPARQPQSGEPGGGAQAGRPSGGAALRWPWLALSALLLALLWAGRGWWREVAPVAGSKAEVGRLFRLAERLGRRYGVPRRRGETPGEYAARVGRVYPSVVPPLSRLAALYERALFAPEPPAAAESAQARRSWEELNRAWARLAGGWRHAWHRWLSW